jgi:hypothetical protein
MRQSLIPLALAAVLTVMSAIGHVCQAQDVPRLNCDPFQRDLPLAPLDAGPLRLKTVYCQRPRSFLISRTAPIVSPDAQWVAYLENDEILRIERLGTESWIDFQTKMGVFAHFSGFGSPSLSPIAWASNSKSVFAANHDATAPGGFATSPLQPLMAASDGNVLTLPFLQHNAGPLDGLLWVDGDGLAIAQFGTKGSLYRPEHPDPDPSFAVVDVQRGVVRDTLAFTAIYRIKGAPYAVIRNAAATKLASGKVRTLIDVGSWIVWTEGEAPVAVAHPYPDDRFNRIVMAPDGSRVLLAREPPLFEMICEHRPACGPPVDPVEGVIAALYDIKDGHELWTVRATVKHNSLFPLPAISPDGRFALIGLPPEGHALIALVAMADGRIVQKIPLPAAYATMGFANGGQLVWTHGYGVTALYDIGQN